MKYMVVQTQMVVVDLVHLESHQVLYQPELNPCLWFLLLRFQVSHVWIQWNFPNKIKLTIKFLKYRENKKDPKNNCKNTINLNNIPILECVREKVRPLLS